MYNLGIRPERYFVQGITLTQIISLEEAFKYSRVFFDVVHPWHAYLVQESFEARLQRHYAELIHDPSFEMLVAFVASLGSYFSFPDRLSQEEELVDRATTWMDRSVFPDVNAQMCIFYVGAWVTRAIYLRAVSNPRSAWMSSCLAMHVVESMGLHKEWDSLPTMAQNAADRPTPLLMDARRRIYWTAFSINRLISTEYGRSSVEIAGTNCKDVDWKPGERFQLLVDTARSLPLGAYLNEDLKIQAYFDAVSQLSHAPGDYIYIHLVRGDVACLLYRRLSLMNAHLPEHTTKEILALGQQALEAATVLAQERRPWWKVISSPFQFLCVLLSLDSTDSLKLVPQALQALLLINEVFATQRTREAYETANLLVQIAQQKKEKELACLRDGLAVSSTTDASVIRPEALADMDLNFDYWMDLMDPALYGVESII